MNNLYDIGMIGLGVMGGNLALNLAEHGFAVAGSDRDAAKVRAFEEQARSWPIKGFQDLREMVQSLRQPRAALILVPAGAVDQVVEGLLGLLEPDDIIIDGGNSYYHDTERRGQLAAQQSLAYLGVGISGGQAGARHGASLMVGGSAEAYRTLEPLFQAVAAKVGGQPCEAYLGQGAAGHFVKMIHNGIEYALMRLLAEAYDLMKRGLEFNNEQIAEVFERWNRGVLAGYLVEITARIFRQVDPRTGGPLIDVILDEAQQKGTGAWTLQSALELSVPSPMIDMAVSMRYLSMNKPLRQERAKLFHGPSPRYGGLPEPVLRQLENALYIATVMTFAEGMGLLRAASNQYGYGMNLSEVARIWRGGCIIRCRLLESIRLAYTRHEDLADVLADEEIASSVRQRQEDLRAIVRVYAESGIPAPGLMTALACLDSYRSAWLPANLIQAQRDYFGAHGYRRTDLEGVFHTQWLETLEAARTGGGSQR